MKKLDYDGAPHLPVIYRDERLLVVNKPAGMVVHRGFANDRITVADIVRDCLVGAPVHAVHRLDRGTSGILVFALDPEAAAFFQAGLGDGGADQIQKRYLCLVRGPMKEEVLVDHPVPNRDGTAKVPAITLFKPLSHKDRFSLVEAIPQTGRLHQIRRHLKHLSHPIVGDVKYGKGEINRYFRQTFNLNRMALHASRLSFVTPDGLYLDLVTELPADLCDPLIKLGIALPVPGNNSSAVKV